MLLRQGARFCRNLVTLGNYCKIKTACCLEAFPGQGLAEDFRTKLLRIPYRYLFLRGEIMVPRKSGRPGPAFQVQQFYASRVECGTRADDCGLR